MINDICLIIEESILGFLLERAIKRRVRKCFIMNTEFGQDMALERLCIDVDVEVNEQVQLKLNGRENTRKHNEK